MTVPPCATTLSRIASWDLAMLPRLNCTKPNVRAPTVAAHPALGDMVCTTVVTKGKPTSTLIQSGWWYPHNHYFWAGSKSDVQHLASGLKMMSECHIMWKQCIFHKQARTLQTHFCNAVLLRLAPINMHTQRTHVGISLGLRLSE